MEMKAPRPKRPKLEDAARPVTDAAAAASAERPQSSAAPPVKVEPHEHASDGEDEYDHLVGGCPLGWLPQWAGDGIQASRPCDGACLDDDQYLWKPFDDDSELESDVDDSDAEVVPGSAAGAMSSFVPSSSRGLSCGLSAAARVEIRAQVDSCWRLPVAAAPAWLARCTGLLGRLSGDAIALDAARLALLERLLDAMQLGARPSPVLVVFARAGATSGLLPPLLLLRRLRDAIATEARALGLLLPSSVPPGSFVPAVPSSVRRLAPPDSGRLITLVGLASEVLLLALGTGWHGADAMAGNEALAAARAAASFLSLLCDVAYAGGVRLGAGGVGDSGVEVRAACANTLWRACKCAALLHALCVAQGQQLPEWSQLCAAASAACGDSGAEDAPLLLRLIAQQNGPLLLIAQQNGPGDASATRDPSPCIPLAVFAASRACFAPPTSTLPRLGSGLVGGSALWGGLLGQGDASPLEALLGGLVWREIGSQAGQAGAQSGANAGGDIAGRGLRHGGASATGPEPGCGRCAESRALAFMSGIAQTRGSQLYGALASAVWVAGGGTPSGGSSVAERLRLLFTHAVSLPLPPKHYFPAIAALSCVVGPDSISQLLWRLAVGGELLAPGGIVAGHMGGDAALHLGVATLAFLDGGAVNRAVNGAVKGAAAGVLLSRLVQRVWPVLLPAALTPATAPRAALAAHLLFGLLARAAECGREEGGETAAAQTAEGVAAARMLSSLALQVARLLDSASLAEPRGEAPSPVLGPVSRDAVLGFGSLFALLAVRHSAAHLQRVGQAARRALAAALLRAGFASLALAWLDFGDAREAHWSARLLGAA